MKQRTYSAKFMPTALAGTTPVMAVDAGILAIASHVRSCAQQLRAPNRRLRALSVEEMVEVAGGMINMSVGVQIQRAITARIFDELVDAGFVVVCDEGGGCTW